MTTTPSNPYPVIREPAGGHSTTTTTTTTTTTSATTTSTDTYLASSTSTDTYLASSTSTDIYLASSTTSDSSTTSTSPATSPSRTTEPVTIPNTTPATSPTTEPVTIPNATPATTPPTQASTTQPQTVPSQPLISSQSISVLPVPTPSPNGTVPVVIPVVTFQMAYASDGKNFYIQGGLSGNGYVGMFYSLNLLISWNASLPAWRQLAPSTFSGTAASLDSKGQFLMTSGINQINVFENSSWSSIGTNRMLEAKGPVMAACFENIWFFGSGEGYNVSESSLNTVTPNNLTLSRPADSRYTLAEGYAVSSSTKNDVLRTSPNNAGTIDVQKFSLQTYDWIPLNATGANITQREGHCFVPNIDGSKYYLFGGQANVSHVDTLYGELYEYDLGTNAWKTLPPTTPRSHMACAVAEKAFVVWGGRAFSNGTIAGADPLVFDFATSNWGSTFHGTQDPSPGPTSAPTSSPTAHLAAIIAGAAAALVLVIIITAITVYYFLKRQRSKESLKRLSRNSSLLTMPETSGLLQSGLHLRDYEQFKPLDLSLSSDSMLDLEVKASDTTSNPQALDYQDSDTLTVINYL
ncbi:hypothetical protein BGX26_011992 [Mortierella sp. AD094]|nr:hypothetical protein BGX26_011992 [Mortierella sp. AD094]